MSRMYRSKSSRIRTTNDYPYRKRKSARRPGLLIAAVSLVLLVCVGAGIIALMNQGGSEGALLTSSAEPNANSNNMLGSDHFYDGVFVDNIPLGGLTRDEARALIEAGHEDHVKTMGVTIVDSSNAKTTLKISDLPEEAYYCDTESILDRSWGLGRDKATNEEKLAFINQLPENPVKLTTTITVDPSAFEQKVRDLAAPFYKEPQDAKYDPEGFDPTKEGVERLSFIPDVPGQQVNADKLWESVKAEFADRTYDDVQMVSEVIPPAVTAADMKANMQLVKISSISAGNASENKKLNTENEGHTYTTQIFDHSKERLTNIRLANEAVSGIVMPGEVFSMNERTGERTAAKGYKIAPIDRSGIVDKGLGGGVCQTSGTLYNAAVRYGGKYESETEPAAPKEQPGLAITARDSHSLPSKYLHTGMDATVDYASNKDIQFRNDFDKPVLIVMYYDKNSKGEYFEHCDIYGPPLPDGTTYDLIRKNAKSIPADTKKPPKTVYSKYATPGAPTYIEPRTGYSVDIHIEKNVNGKKTSVYAYSSSYKPQPAAYYVYVGETAPTPTPSPTPEPTATPKPTEEPTTAPTTEETPMSTTPSPSPTPETTAMG